MSVATAAATPRPITPEQSEQERAILFAVLADTAIEAPMLLIAVMGGSLTILAETIRGAMMQSIELFSLLVMRRIHRGVLSDLEFGTGKLEQVANLMIGAGMLGSGLWIAYGAIALATGERAAGTPFGLAMAAAIGAVNLYLNLLTWDVARRAPDIAQSLIMQAQLKSRTVKLVSSIIVQVTMTIAALSTDNVIVASADAAGSLMVAIVIFVTALGILGAGVPDLLDRSAGREVREAVDRALADHAGAYQRCERVRSRRSGTIVFVEVALGFDPGLSVAEVERRIALLKAAMRRDIAGAEVAIILAAPL